MNMHALNDVLTLQTNLRKGSIKILLVSAIDLGQGKFAMQSSRIWLLAPLNPASCAVTVRGSWNRLANAFESLAHKTTINSYFHPQTHV